MKKARFVLLSALVALLLASCSILGAVLTAAETMYTPYVLDETTDIYGHHVTTAIAVDKQTEGLAASDFTVRVLKKTLDDELVSYGLLFRETDNLTNDGYYYMSMFPLLKVDDQVFDFPLESLPEYMSAGDIRFKEVEVTLPDEAVEALKTAENVYVQYYEVNDKDKLIQLTPEGVQAIKDFLNN